MSRLIEAREATQEWRSAALEDALTGVGSRRQIEGRLRGALAEYTHHGGLVGLLFMDIDHFKQVNDTYGHDVGDRVLQLVGTTLLHNLRATDAVGRWGGDEFIAVVTGIPGESALKALAEKLQALVACSRLDLGSSSVAVTLSIGVTLVRPGDTAESIMLRADRQLYHSKGAGSDRVSCGPGSDAAQPR
jgi:diguanylate cyclase (GGDEF)-like protein